MINVDDYRRSPWAHASMVDAFMVYAFQLDVLQFNVLHGPLGPRSAPGTTPFALLNFADFQVFAH
jgi:hypothetical protein